MSSEENTAQSAATVSTSPLRAPGGGSSARLEVKMLNDRLLVTLATESAERRSRTGIVIPATASVGKQLAWGEVVAAGQSVRHVEVGDHVLFEPEDRGEVELSGQTYLLLRERDVHGIATPQGSESATGLYL